VKLGLDLPVERLLQLLELLPELGYDGIVLGNTSTAHEVLLPQIAPSERRAYNAFWQRIGGGVSGRPLRPLRQELLRQARTWLQLHPPQREFHLVAVGGIATPQELAAALSGGAALAQWMTGYFEVLTREPLSPYAYMSTALVQDP
jgi:dihydroorotate dehydrogenase